MLVYTDDLIKDYLKRKTYYLLHINPYIRHYRMYIRKKYFLNLLSIYFVEVFLNFINSIFLSGSFLLIQIILKLILIFSFIIYFSQIFFKRDRPVPSITLKPVLTGLVFNEYCFTKNSLTNNTT